MSDLDKGQHARITVVLQGALADVEQPAHITVVQPIGVPALFSECLLAGFGKTEYLVPQLCPCRFCNEKYPIVLLFIFNSISFSALYRRFLSAKLQCAYYTSKHQGTVGKHWELEGKGILSNL